MPLYVFHLCRQDGTSPAFEAFELQSDDEVLKQAVAMLEHHASCDHVTAWRGDEFVMRLDRNGRRPPARRRNDPQEGPLH